METPRAYSRKQWFWAVNLIAVLGAAGFLVPAGAGNLSQLLGALPFVLVVTLIVAWVFVAYPLSIAMRKPASWGRAIRWGAASAVSIALVGFLLASAQRMSLRMNPNSFSQIGGGDYIREIDGVLTPYGWWVVLQNNLLFVVLGITIALIVRAIIGPGRVMQ